MMLLRDLIDNRENVHLDGHPDWDAGYVSAMALMAAHLEAIERNIRNWPEDQLTHADVIAMIRAGGAW